MRKRDKLISELLKEIEVRKTEIKKDEIKIKNFKPLTTLSMMFEGSFRNLHTQSSNDLLIILSSIKTTKDAFDKICLENNINIEFEFQEYSYNDWEYDIIGLIRKNEITKKKRDLAVKESILKNKYSQDKKDDIEIDLIKKELGF